MAAIVAVEGSNVTVAVLASKSTATDFTPDTLSMAFLTVTGHSAQVMFSMAKICRCSAVAACSEADNAVDGRNAPADRALRLPDPAPPRKS